MKTTEQRLKEMGLSEEYKAAQERVSSKGGTSETSQQLIARSKEQISQSKEMLDASNLGNVPKLPDIPYSEYTPTDANDSVSKTYTEAKAITTSNDILLDRLADVDKKIEATETKKKSWLEKRFAEPEETYEDKRAALMKELGIKEESELVKQQNVKVATLQGDLDKIELQQREEIDRAYDRPTAMPNIRAEINEVNRAYDRKKAYKAVEISSQVAILQAYQGNLNMSYDSLDSAIKGWMWDYEENRKRWEVMYDYHSDYLDDLTAEHRQIYDMAYDSAVREEETAKESSDYKRELWANAAQRGVYLDFNDMLNMTDDEATDIYAKKVAGAGTGWATGTPTSRKEWELAGGETGMGMSYAEFINKSNVSTPTIYGLTKEQTQDVLFSPYTPDWFSNQMTNIHGSSDASRDEREWGKYKKDVVEKSKEIKQELGVSSLIDDLYNPL